MFINDVIASQEDWDQLMKDIAEKKVVARFKKLYCLRMAYTN